ncbi:MAG: polymer-forming cytoskeletal protein [Patescibacteria group bacterium]
MENDIDTIIGLNVILKGNIKNKGSIQVNGTIEGEVRSDEHINIGETAKVKGPVIAKTVEVSGEVSGLIEASERLEIHPTGRVTGDINAKSLIIQNGAIFVGKSIMPSKGSVGDLGKAETTIEEVFADSDKEDKKDKGQEEDKEEKEKDPLGFFRK